MDQKLPYIYYWLRYFFPAWKCIISGVVWESKFWHLRTGSALIFSKWLKQRCNIPHFKAFGMSNFKCDVRICQKIRMKGTMTQNRYFSFRWLRLYLSLFLGTIPRFTTRSILNVWKTIAISKQVEKRTYFTTSFKNTEVEL